MMNRISDILTYSILAVLCFVFVKEGASYVTYNLTGLKIPVYQPAKAEAAVPKGKQLKLLTYNILVDPVALDRRQAPLFKILADSGADVIALQEVGALDGWFMQQLEKEPWAKAYYRAGREPNDCNGQFILSKLPVEDAICHGLPGGNGRTVLIATVTTASGPLKIATTHMDSPLGISELRGKQLDVIFKALGTQGDAALMGDLNFGDGEPESARLDPAYGDMWRKLRPKDPGYTWDNEKSDLARGTKFAGEPSRRLDRILVRSKNWKPQAINIIGDQPTDKGKKDMFPSDHFGLAAVLSR